MRMYKIAIAFLLFGVISAETVLAEELRLAERPNILLIVVDDMAFSDLGAFGGEIHTPNLDKLAFGGARLTNFHAAPTCSPTRAMLMSGTDNHLAGMGNMAEVITDNQRGKPGYEGYLTDRVAPLPELMRDAGYLTYMVGKWHLGDGTNLNPAARGFDESFALIQGGGSHFDNRGLLPNEPSVHYLENGKTVELPRDFYSTEFYTDKLISYIERHSGDEKPFFAYLAYTAPHWPLQAPDSIIDKYAGSYEKGYEWLRQKRLERLKELGLVDKNVEANGPIPNVTPWEELSPKERTLEARRMEIYAAMVESVDTHIGRLLNRLESLRLAKNTLIFFMSDNGAMAPRIEAMPQWSNWIEKNFDNTISNFGKRGSYVSYGPGWASATSVPFRKFKGHLTEGGTRVAAFVNYSRLPVKKKVIASYLTVMDVLPTFVDLAGGDIPREHYKGRRVVPVIGKSMLSLWKGRASRVHDELEPIGWELFGQRALVQGSWKIVWIEEPVGVGDWQLYHLSSDVAESRDLSEQYPQVRERMAKLWHAYAREKGVILPAP